MGSTTLESRSWRYRQSRPAAVAPTPPSEARQAFIQHAESRNLARYHEPRPKPVAIARALSGETDG